MNKIIIANWKMSLSFSQTIDLTKKIKKGLKKNSKKNIDIVICPSSVALAEVSKLIKKTKIKLGAQNAFWEQRGAFTSGVSPLILKELGCEYVIVGHSDRRKYWEEPAWMINKKVKAVLEARLIPIICVGEKFEERKNHTKDLVVIEQVSKALEGVKIKKTDKVIIAYEPVWAIGSGQTVKPIEAEYTNKVIKHELINLYPKKLVDNNFRTIYGGSINSKIVKSFTDQPTIDGVLVGGKSLKADEFVKIIKAVVDK